MNALGFSPLHSFRNSTATPRGELSVLRSSFQILTKGKLLMQQARLVERAGAIEWVVGL